MKVIIDLDFIKNYKELPSTVQLLFLLFDLTAREGNKMERKKAYFADYIGVQKQTAGAYLQEFANSNLLKYRYGGPTFVNPGFCRSISEEEYGNLYNEYIKFKSTI